MAKFYSENSSRLTQYTLKELLADDPFFSSLVIDQLDPNADSFYQDLAQAVELKTSLSEEEPVIVSSNIEDDTITALDRCDAFLAKKASQSWENARLFSNKSNMTDAFSHITMKEIETELSSIKQHVSGKHNDIYLLSAAVDESMKKLLKPVCRSWLTATHSNEGSIILKLFEFKYLAHIKNVKGSVAAIDKVGAVNTMKLEGFHTLIFLQVRARFLLKEVVAFDNIKPNKIYDLNALKAELLTTLQSLEMFSAQSLLFVDVDPQTPLINKPASINRNLLESLKNQVYRSIIDLDPQQTYTIASGFLGLDEDYQQQKTISSGHALYINFEKIDNNRVLIRVDNGGYGVLQYHSRKLGSKKKFFPFFSGTHTFSESTEQVMKEYIERILIAFRFVAKSANEATYDIPECFEPLSSSDLMKVKQSYSAYSAQTVGNCVFYNFNIGTGYRLGEKAHQLLLQREASYAANYSTGLIYLNAHSRTEPNNEEPHPVLSDPIVVQELLPRGHDVAYNAFSLKNKAILAALTYPDINIPIPKQWAIDNTLSSGDVKVFYHTGISVLYICYRGTFISKSTYYKDIIADIQTTCKKAPTLFRDFIMPLLKQIYTKYSGWEITHIGHSLGGVYAQLASDAMAHWNNNNGAICFDTPGLMTMFNDIGTGLNFDGTSTNYYLTKNFCNAYDQPHCNTQKLGIDKLPKMHRAKILLVHAQLKYLEKLLKNPTQKAAVLGFYIQQHVKLCLLTHGIHYFLAQLGYSSATQQLTQQATRIISESPAIISSILPSIQYQPNAKMLIWKQDPSVDSTTKEVILHGVFENGPSNKVAKIVGVEAEKTTENAIGSNKHFVSFTHDPTQHPEKANATHTFAVVHKVYQLFLRASNKYNIPWDKQWSTKEQPLLVFTDHNHPLLGQLVNKTFDKNFKNAFYARTNLASFLVFGRFDHKGKNVSTCRSFDVVAHETGHAILDSFKPHFNAQKNLEAFALHEAFGDLTVLFSVLNEPDMRHHIVNETYADLSKNSELTTIAEEFGSAMYDTYDGLRNINNNCTTHNTGKQNFHDFSLVFSGAVYHILVKFFSMRFNPDLHDAETALRKATRDVFKLVFNAYFFGPDSNANFEDIATLMYDVEEDPEKKLIIADEFLFRGVTIESASFSTNLQEAQLSRNQTPRPVIIEKSTDIPCWTMSMIDSTGATHDNESNIIDETYQSTYLNKHSETPLKKEDIDSSDTMSPSTMHSYSLVLAKVMSDELLCEAQGDTPISVKTSRRADSSSHNKLNTQTTKNPTQTQALIALRSLNQPLTPDNDALKNKFSHNSLILQEQFVRACAKGDCDTIKELYQKGALIDQPSLNGLTPFVAAIRSLDLDAIKFIAKRAKESHGAVENLPGLPDSMDAYLDGLKPRAVASIQGNTNGSVTRRWFITNDNSFIHEHYQRFFSNGEPSPQAFKNDLASLLEHGYNIHGVTPVISKMGQFNAEMNSRINNVRDYLNSECSFKKKLGSKK